VNGVFKKRKVRLCVMGNQQKEGVHYQLGELYARGMKASEVRSFVAIAARHRFTVSKSVRVTKQAFLNGEIWDEKIYIRALDWWQERVPVGLTLLLKSMYGTHQAAWKWHVRISTWMEDHGYEAENSEKTIFMKHENEDWIMHCLFVDDMIHASTSEKRKLEFIAEYQGDFRNHMRGL
jgi:hypothetical protein